ncbi:MAG: hypothetical protein H6767_06670 [Candidatus Peribacteria bacterium]|nr:MAG: hypothetical protein H6767_06670 [Candidatus Peribacteria bacterium]
MQHGGQLVKGSMDLFMSVATFIMIAALGVFANNDDAGQLWNFIYTMFLIGAVYDLTINNVALLKIFHFTKER